MLDWLAHRAAISPQNVALIFQEQPWSYAALNRLVANLCAQLATAGVQAGQHVAVLMPNRVEYVGVVHALARLGAVLVPLNLRLTPAELRWQIKQANCVWLVCNHDTAATAAGLECPTLNLPALPPASNAQAWDSRPLNLEAVQGVLFTSGTTGRPKGAMLTFNNHLWGATASAFRLGTGPADRWLLCMPLYHVGGIAILFRCCLYGTAVVLQAGFETGAVARALKTEGVSLVSLVPTMLHRLLESEPDCLTGSALRCILLGGAAASPTLQERCRRLNLPVATTYGLTEAASQVATALPEAATRLPGSVGRPLMFLQVQIVDQARQSLPAGETGEILVAGPTVMRGYYRQARATAQTVRNGWLHTGDMGYLDTGGNLWVVQRRADLIVSGGENVYPVEVENLLRQHPAVVDACVVGLADETWGQRVAAVVVAGQPGLSESELVAFCRERLAGYKQPRLIRFVDSLPLTASGKVRRGEVEKLLG